MKGFIILLMAICCFLGCQYSKAEEANAEENFGKMLCDEQEKCFNYSFDKAERRYGTEVASPDFEDFNHYRMRLYAECESEFFRKHGLRRDEGYEIYRDSGCSVIPMPDGYYKDYP